MRGYLLLFGFLVLIWGGLPFLSNQSWFPPYVPITGTTYSIVGMVLGLLMLIIGFRSKPKKKDVL